MPVSPLVVDVLTTESETDFEEDPEIVIVNGSSDTDGNDVVVISDSLQSEDEVNDSVVSQSISDCPSLPSTTVINSDVVAVNNPSVHSAPVLSPTQRVIIDCALSTSDTTVKESPSSRNEPIYGPEDDVIEIVQYTSQATPINNAPGPSNEYVVFYDPLLDSMEGVTEIDETSRDPIYPVDACPKTDTLCGTPSGNLISNSSSSSSRKCVKRKKINAGAKEKASKSLNELTDESNNAELLTSAKNSSDSASEPVCSTSKHLLHRQHKRARIAKVPLSESDDDSSSSLFEAVVVRKKKKPLPKKTNNSKASKNLRRKDKGGTQNCEQRVLRRKNNKKSEKRVKLTDVPPDSTDTGSSSSEKETVNDEDTKKNSRVSRTSRRRNGDEEKNKREEALALLRQRREKFANKPKRPSPERNTSPATNTSETGDSDSSYTTGSSPCPVVDDGPLGSSDFDCSTPSSSSVTSSGITDEEPDLEIGGSDGEKELIKEEKESSSDDNETKSCSSSSEDESPDDGQNDERCILCKNLGSIDVTGRSSKKKITWCKCGECRNFTSEVRDYDLVCCREIKTVVEFLKEELDDGEVCVTTHSRFKLDVLENEAYARSISKHAAARRYGGQFWGNFYENYSCGKADYRKAENAQQRFEASSTIGKMYKCLSSYLHWIFDQLGHEKGQMVIPACVQHKIRKHFKVPSYVFSSFQAKHKCPNGRHCRLAN